MAPYFVIVSANSLEMEAPAEISDRLRISEKTFFNHRSHILEKIEGRNNVSIVKYAFEHGLLDLATA
jgi:DNA-binding NarL/FixJ family response regulator